MNYFELFGDELDIEDTKFPVKYRDIHKIEKKLFFINERKERKALCPY